MQMIEPSMFNWMKPKKTLLLFSDYSFAFSSYKKYTQIEMAKDEVYLGDDFLSDFQKIPPLQGSFQTHHLTYR